MHILQKIIPFFIIFVYADTYSQKGCCTPQNQLSYKAVYIDNKHISTTPLYNHFLLTNCHTVRFKNKPHNTQKYKTIEITADPSSTLSTNVEKEQGLLLHRQLNIFQFARRRTVTGDAFGSWGPPLFKRVSEQVGAAGKNIPGNSSLSHSGNHLIPEIIDSTTIYDRTAVALIRHLVKPPLHNPEIKPGVHIHLLKSQRKLYEDPLPTIEIIKDDIDKQDVTIKKDLRYLRKYSFSIGFCLFTLGS